MHEFTCICSLNHIHTKAQAYFESVRIVENDGSNNDHILHVTVGTTAVYFNVWNKMPLVHFSISGSYWNQFQWFNWCAECVYGTILPHICSEQQQKILHIEHSAHITTFFICSYSSNNRGESNKKQQPSPYLFLSHTRTQGINNYPASIRELNLDKSI